MGIMDTYKIDLMSSGLGGKTFEYEIGDGFFAGIGELIQHGNIHTTVVCLNAGAVFKFQIHSVGTVIVPCDRCLSDLELRIETTDDLNVKMGNAFVDEGDYVIVPEADGCIDLAQFIYEFIVLSMPITCCHESGECDNMMMQELYKHQSARSGEVDVGGADLENAGLNVSGAGGEDAVEPVDSWWEALKQLKNKQ